MKGVYANIAWFLLVVAGLVLAFVDRHTAQGWSSMSDVRVMYDLLYGSLALYLVGCATGLFLKRKWAYQHALAANVTLALLPCGMLLGSLWLLLPDLGLVSLLKIQAINLAIGFVSLCFWLYLRRSSVASAFHSKSA